MIIQDSEIQAKIDARTRKKVYEIEGDLRDICAEMKDINSRIYQIFNMISTINETLYLFTEKLTNLAITENALIKEAEILKRKIKND